jgi:hypothetical protein
MVLGKRPDDECNDQIYLALLKFTVGLADHKVTVDTRHRASPEALELYQHVANSMRRLIRGIAPAWARRAPRRGGQKKHLCELVHIRFVPFEA